MSPESSRASEETGRSLLQLTPLLDLLHGDTVSQTWLYLRINTWDTGQVYLSSHKIKAELATVITAIIEGLIQGSNVQEMGAKLLFMQKA